MTKKYELVESGMVKRLEFYVLFNSLFTTISLILMFLHFTKVLDILIK